MCRGASYSNFGNATVTSVLRSRGFFGSVGNDGSAFSGYGSRVGVVCGAGLLKRNIGIASEGASFSNLVGATYPIGAHCRSFFGVGGGEGPASSDYSCRIGVVCGAGLLKRNIGIVSEGASYSNFGYATDSVTLRGRGIFSCYGHGGYGASNISSRVSVVCGAGLLKKNIGIVSWCFLLRPC